jgi:hypothetical protein
MATESKPAVAKVLDFTNVKDRGEFNPKHKPAGDYLGVIAKVADQASAAGNNQWIFTITLPDDATAAYRYNCLYDNENQLWKIRNLCVAAGIQVPKKKVKLDPNKLVGKKIGISLEDDEYEGKLKSVIEAVFPESELEQDETTGSATADVDDEDLDEVEIDEL